MTLKEKIEIKLINYPAIYGLARSCYHKTRAIIERVAPDSAARKNGEQAGFFVKDNIAFVDIKDIDRFSYSSPEGVAVIMPCIDRAKGLATAGFLHKRAGMACVIVVAYDSRRQGFVKTLNDTAFKTDVAYVVYLAQDAFPGRNWLKIAYDSLKKENKGLFAFNDGVWQDKIAVFGMVEKKWVQGLYGNSIFFNQYKSHVADIELTIIARALDMLVYNPNSVLIELDTDKEDKGVSNPYDLVLLKNRFQSGFNGLVPYEKTVTLAEEYSTNTLQLVP